MIGPGPASGSSTVNALARWANSTGTVLKNSGAILDNSNNLSGINTLTVNNLEVLTSLTTGDNIIILLDQVTGPPTANAGLEVTRGTSTNSTLLWDESIDKWTAGLVGTRYEIALNEAALTANRAIASNASGRLVVSAVTDTELGYLTGVTSAIQTQLNGKQATGNYLTALTSDVSASGPGSAAATVNSVGGSSASNVNAATLLANAATSANTASAIVRRDGSGSFVAQGIQLSGLTASLPVVTDSSKNLASVSYATFAGNLPHASLSGLTTTDAGHTQFALLAGRLGGQTLIGGSAQDQYLTLKSNPSLSAAHPGKIFLETTSELYTDVVLGTPTSFLGLNIKDPSIAALLHINDPTAAISQTYTAALKVTTANADRGFGVDYGDVLGDATLTNALIYNFGLNSEGAAGHIYFSTNINASNPVMYLTPDQSMVMGNDIGIGDIQLNVDRLLGDADSAAALVAVPTITFSGGSSSANYYGLFFQPQITSSDNTGGDNVFGVNAQVLHNIGAGTSNLVLGGLYSIDNAGGTIVSAVAVTAEINNEGTMGSACSMTANQPSGTGAFTQRTAVNVVGTIAVSPSSRASTATMIDLDADSGTGFWIITNGTGAGWTLAGITGGMDGKMVTVLNLSGFAMTIANLSGSAATGKKINTMSGGNIVTGTSSIAEFVYVSGLGQWVLKSYR